MRRPAPSAPQSPKAHAAWTLAHDENSRYFLIANGLANNAMPAYGDVLTPAQIHAIMEFIQKREGL